MVQNPGSRRRVRLDRGWPPGGRRNSLPSTTPNRCGPIQGFRGSADRARTQHSGDATAEPVSGWQVDSVLLYRDWPNGSVREPVGSQSWWKVANIYEWRRPATVVAQRP